MIDRPGRRQLGWFVGGGFALAVTLSGCGSSGIAAPPLETSIGQAFGNLYVLQQVEQGDPKPAAAGLQTQARCQKGTPDTAQTGAGDDWVCQITYLVAGPATPVTALYNVNVQTNGCYAAEGEGPASVNGSRTITGASDRQLINPLRLIDGCFQPA